MSEIDGLKHLEKSEVVVRGGGLTWTDTEYERQLARGALEREIATINALMQGEPWIYWEGKPTPLVPGAEDEPEEDDEHPDPPVLALAPDGSLVAAPVGFEDEPEAEEKEYWKMWICASKPKSSVDPSKSRGAEMARWIASKNPLGDGLDDMIMDAMDAAEDEFYDARLLEAITQAMLATEAADERSDAIHRAISAPRDFDGSRLAEATGPK